MFISKQITKGNKTTLLAVHAIKKKIIAIFCFYIPDYEELNHGDLKERIYIYQGYLRIYIIFLSVKFVVYSA